MKRALQAVIDTNVMVSISRAPTLPPNDQLTAAIERGRLVACVDQGRGIISEWEQTAKREVVQQLIIHWQQYKGLRVVVLTRTLPQAVARALPRLGFKDTGDKLILRTAYNTEDKRIVTNDPDFWDPKDKSSTGRPGAPVARLCREKLEVRVSTLKATIDEFHGS